MTSPALFSEIDKLVDSLEQGEIHIKAARLLIAYAEDVVQNVKKIIPFETERLINDTFAFEYNAKGFVWMTSRFEAWQTDFAKLYRTDRKCFWRAICAVYEFLNSLKARLEDVQKCKQEAVRVLEGLGFSAEAVEQELMLTKLLARLK